MMDQQQIGIMVDGAIVIQRVLAECGGNTSEAARRLGVSRVTVWKRIKKYGIDLKKVLTQQNPA